MVPLLHNSTRLYSLYLKHVPHNVLYHSTLRVAEAPIAAPSNPAALTKKQVVRLFTRVATQVLDSTLSGLWREAKVKYQSKGWG
jgi:hypothetical protein